MGYLNRKRYENLSDRADDNARASGKGAAVQRMVPAERNPEAVSDRADRAAEVYLALTEKGYEIARKGLTTISDIKNGEFKLHKNRFDSLRIVKSELTALSRLQHITDLHGSINEICEKLPAEIQGCQLLDAVLKKQMITGLKALYDDSQVLIGGFFMVIRDGQVSMTDDERIVRIDELCQAFEENYLFAQNLRKEFGLVCKSAAAELKDLENRRLIHGLK
jgi:hypothetical protein